MGSLRLSTASLPTGRRHSACFVPHLSATPLYASTRTSAFVPRTAASRQPTPQLAAIRKVQCRPVEMRWSGGNSQRGGGVPPLERAVSVLPYLIPLLDALTFGRYVIAAAPAALTTPILTVLSPLYVIYRGTPFVAFGVFLLLYFFVVRNANISRFIRYSTLQSLMLDIALIVPQLLGSLSLGAALPVTVVQIVSSTVFYAVLLVCIYAAFSIAKGELPDQVPLLSDSVNSQMPH